MANWDSHSNLTEICSPFAPCLHVTFDCPILKKFYALLILCRWQWQLLTHWTDSLVHPQGESKGVEMTQAAVFDCPKPPHMENDIHLLLSQVPDFWGLFPSSDTVDSKEVVNYLKPMWSEEARESPYLSLFEYTGSNEHFYILYSSPSLHSSFSTS